MPFCAKSDFGCVVRSSSLTMFGGNIPNGKILKRIDEFQKQNALKATAETCANKQAQNAKTVAQVNEQTGDKITIGATLKDLNLDEWTKYDGNNFYYAVKPQIDELFVRYPEEKILNDAVASSKWAHVQTGEDYYVVGVLFNDDEPSFICYGVPASSNQNPPSELENACVWLPVGDGEKGYWMIYQSARTGEIVK